MFMTDQSQIIDGHIFFQRKTQPTKCDVLLDFHVFWQSPRSRKLMLFVDYIATKQIIAPALNTLVGGSSKVLEA